MRNVTSLVIKPDRRDSVYGIALILARGNATTTSHATRESRVFATFPRKRVNSLSLFFSISAIQLVTFSR